MLYYKKYLKYKNKYMVLKKQIGGDLKCFNPMTSICKKLETGCKIGDFNNKIIPARDNTETKDKYTYNTNLKKIILACNPTLKLLLDTGYTIKEINEFELVSFTFPDIVKYNETTIKKIVFNDMNMLIFGSYRNQRFNFHTCYNKFDYSKLNDQSMAAICDIITLFTSTTGLPGDPEIDGGNMIKYLSDKLIENNYDKGKLKKLLQDLKHTDLANSINVSKWK